jgi:hypothetical protein
VNRVPEVDPGDDAIWRWVVHHYRFDPERGERRNVIVAAYDNEAEFTTALEAYARSIRAEVDAGTRDGAEHVGGVRWHPGHHAEQAHGRTLRSASGHGVDPMRVPLDGPLPSDIGLFGWVSDGTTWSLGVGEPPEPPPA